MKTENLHRSRLSDGLSRLSHRASRPAGITTITAFGADRGANLGTMMEMEPGRAGHMLECSAAWIPPANGDAKIQTLIFCYIKFLK